MISATPSAGSKSTWLTKSLVKVHGIDKSGRILVPKDAFIISSQGLPRLQWIDSRDIRDAVRTASERARVDGAGAQAILRAADGTFYVGGLGLKWQSGDRPMPIEDAAGAARSLWARSRNDDLRGVVGRSSWIDFSGTPMPLP